MLANNEIGILSSSPAGCKLRIDHNAVDIYGVKAMVLREKIRPPSFAEPENFTQCFCACVLQITNHTQKEKALSGPLGWFKTALCAKSEKSGGFCPFYPNFVLYVRVRLVLNKCVHVHALFIYIYVYMKECEFSPAGIWWINRREKCGEPSAHIRW